MFKIAIVLAAFGFGAYCGWYGKECYKSVSNIQVAPQSHTNIKVF